jgi:hypothetical protein
MSTTFTSLPAEIQRECISYLDTVTLKSMRLTSHATKDLATETLFEVASIDPSQDSVENFLQLTSNGDFKRCIRKVRIVCVDFCMVRSAMQCSHVAEGSDTVTKSESVQE